MAKMRRGVVMALGLLLLTLVILLLGFLTFKNGLMMKGSLTSTAEIEMVKNKFVAVEHAVNKLFGDDMSMNRSFNSSGLHMQQEMLPDWSTFQTDVVNFANYMQGAMPEVSMNGHFEQGNLSVMYARQDSPYEFYHVTWWTSSARRMMIDVDPLVQQYEIEVYSPDMNGSPVFSRITAGSVNVSVIVKGKAGHRATASALVDPSASLSDSNVDVTGMSDAVNISMSWIKLLLSDFLGNQGNLSVSMSMNMSAQPVMFFPAEVMVKSNKVQKAGPVRLQ